MGLVETLASRRTSWGWGNRPGERKTMSRRRAATATESEPLLGPEAPLVHLPACVIAARDLDFGWIRRAPRRSAGPNGPQARNKFVIS